MNHLAGALCPIRLVPHDPSPPITIPNAGREIRSKSSSPIPPPVVERLPCLSATHDSSLPRPMIRASWKRAGQALLLAELKENMSSESSFNLVVKGFEEKGSRLDSEGIWSPIANRQDKMEIVDFLLESKFNAQEIALLLSPRLWSPYMTTASTITPYANVTEQAYGDSQPQEHIPGIQVVVTNASLESLADGNTCDERAGHDSIPSSGLTGIALASVPLGIQTEYYKMGESVAVIDATLDESEEAQRIRSFVPSLIVHGIDTRRCSPQDGC
ncbi:hypothetical protein BKA70DRAFT_1573163 [Coprinopsis sp. MPI-PUGE-AT-0042]|nr:hypothetical protein BKA70DRAFT_1573163 [Coprinopsis sp. MPI-PUGE-AT-0042]